MPILNKVASGHFQVPGEVVAKRRTWWQWRHQGAGKMYLFSEIASRQWGQYLHTRGLSSFQRLQRWQELGRHLDDGSTAVRAGNGAVEAVKSPRGLRLGKAMESVCMCGCFWKCKRTTCVSVYLRVKSTYLQDGILASVLWLALLLFLVKLRGSVVSLWWYITRL